MTTYIEFGNIFNIEGVKNYAHGCNCAGSMGKGIAIQFKEKFPKMYLEYKRLCRERQFVPGDVFEYNYGDGSVFNLGTQVSWTTKAEISAIEQSLRKMLQLSSQLNINKIALPRIGAGLGRLEWDDVKSTIDNVSKEYPHIDLFVVENYKED
jgi:O-acetyl-ADP-ribose deacetylase (regulator of RNase III)